jgi:hypothetical protein
VVHKPCGGVAVWVVLKSVPASGRQGCKDKRYLWESNQELFDSHRSPMNCFHIPHTFEGFYRYVHIHIVVKCYPTPCLRVTGVRPSTPATCLLGKG